MGISNELDLIESFLENTFQRAALSTGFNNYHTISVYMWSCTCAKILEYMVYVGIYQKVYIRCHTQGHVEWGGMGGRGGLGGWGLTSTPPPPPTHTHTTHTVFWNLSVFWQNMSVKFPDPMLLVNLEYFIRKTKCRILLISSPTEIKLSPVMMAFKEVI